MERNSELWKQLRDCKTNLKNRDKQIEEKDTLIQKATEDIHQIRLELSKSSATIQDLRTRGTKTRDRLVKRASCASNKLEDILSGVREVSLKENGIFSATTRQMTRDLIQYGVPRSSINGVIKTVSKVNNVNVMDHIDSRSIGRIELEGLVAAKLQIVHEVEHAKCV
jgi:hypothetical protein